MLGSRGLLLLILTGILVVLAGSCSFDFFNRFRLGPDRTGPVAIVTATPSPNGEELSPTVTPVPVVQPPAATATAVAEQPTAVLVPSVTGPEAEALVRAYFAALDAKDFDTARLITTGQARETTDALINAVETEAFSRRVDFAVRTRELRLGPPYPGGSPMLVDVWYVTDINALIGPLSVTARTLQGNATFAVARVDGQPKIVEIQGLLE